MGWRRYDYQKRRVQLSKRGGMAIKKGNIYSGSLFIFVFSIFVFFIFFFISFFKFNIFILVK